MRLVSDPFSATDPRRMRALVERSLDMITVLAPDLTVLFQSQCAVRALGSEMGQGFHLAAAGSRRAGPAHIARCRLSDLELAR